MKFVYSNDKIEFHNDGGPWRSILWIPYVFGAKLLGKIFPCQYMHRCNPKESSVKFYNFWFFIFIISIQLSKGEIGNINRARILKLLKDAVCKKYADQMVIGGPTWFPKKIMERHGFKILFGKIYYKY